MEVAEEHRTVEVVVEWSTVGWPTGESNDVGLTGLLRSVRLAVRANNQALGDGEVHESVPGHDPRFVRPLQAHGDADD
jgi:hypothetical protein